MIPATLGSFSRNQLQILNCFIGCVYSRRCSKASPSNVTTSQLRHKMTPNLVLLSVQEKGGGEWKSHVWVGFLPANGSSSKFMPVYSIWGKKYNIKPYFL